MLRIVLALKRLLLLSLLLLILPGSAAAAPCYAQPMGPASLWNLLSRGDYSSLDARLGAAQASYRAGSINDAELNALFISLCDSDARLRANYDAWIAAMPRSYVALLARANYLRHQGWDARGDDYAASTSAERFAAQDRFFLQASKDYEDSLQLDGKPILSYAGLVNVGRQGSTSRREVVDEALTIDPKAFVVRRTYMVLLETRWHGSVAEMQQFAAQSKGYITASQYRVLDAMAIEDRGWNIEQAGDELGAARLYQSAVERVDDSSLVERTWYAQLNFETGWAYQHASDLPSALLWYRRAVALNPSNHHALSSLAWTLQKSGQASEAASFYQKSAALGDCLRAGPVWQVSVVWPRDRPGPASGGALHSSARQVLAPDEASSDLYWATRQLHLPPEGSLAGAAKPAANPAVVGKTSAGCASQIRAPPDS